MTKHRAYPFLAAFNDLEAFLREAINAKVTDGFSWMAKQARHQGLISDTQLDMLKDFAHLRNAISHGLYYGDEPIAEPTPEVVADIEKLRDILLSPPLALDILGQKPVETLSPDTPVQEVFSLVSNKDYFYYPVYDRGEFLQLLTTHALAKWVAASGTKAAQDTSRRVRDVLKYAGGKEQVVFLPRDASAVEVIEALSVVTVKGSVRNGSLRSCAVILTEVGSKDQKPLRIVTAVDLSKLFKAVS